MRLTAITAGSNYLDIDAYACCVALAELLTLQGIRAVAYSSALPNYSVCCFLSIKGQIWSSPPENIHAEEIQYIVVDVSDPDYIMREVPLEQVIEVYDHHVGFESYWQERIGAGAHIEFIGAAATLIYREWKKAGLQAQMSPSTARLLMAAILDNTLDLTSSNTTKEDRGVYAALCRQAGADDSFRGTYFSQVQKNVEADLQKALKNDLKYVGDHSVLPTHIAQLCVWDADGMLEKLSNIRQCLDDIADYWMLNLVDIKHRCCYFVCDDPEHQKKIAKLFDVHFTAGVARSAKTYLRKQIMKRVLSSI